MGKAMPVAPLPLGHDYGLHRVIEPAGLLPQPAWRIDNQMTLHDNELLIDVQALNVDAASFTQIREEVGDDRLTERVLEIVAQRGKLHNPVTGSGGDAVGHGGRHRPALPQSRRVEAG